MAGVVVRAGLGAPRRHRPPQCTTSAHALQFHNEYVDLKPDGMTKKKIMMTKLISENFERFGHAITLQRRCGALPKVVQGGGLRLVHVSPICKLSKNRPCFADVGPIRTSSSVDLDTQLVAKKRRRSADMVALGVTYNQAAAICHRGEAVERGVREGAPASPPYEE